MARSLMAVVGSLAAQQGGVVARRQLLAAGCSSSSVARHVANGTLTTWHGGVYVAAGVPLTTATRRWAALLTTKPSVLSFDTAARIHRFSHVAATGDVTVTVKHSGYRRIRGIVVHQINDLWPQHIQTVEAMPVTTAARTFVDLAATWRMGRLARSLDDAVAAKTTTIADVGRCLQSVARRGKPGVRVLTTILDERGPGTIPPQSALETDFFRMLEPSWLPTPQRQHPLPSRDGRTSYADAAWPQVRLIVEVDSRRWHQRMTDMARDRERDMQAAGQGWMVVRVMAEHVRDRPAETRAELERIYLQRLEGARRRPA